MPSKDGLRLQVISGLFWTIGERIIVKFVGFVISVILARLLLPEDYGVVALVLVFIAIIDIIAESGFGGALIQKKDADAIDFSSVFFFSIVFSIILYMFLFFSSEYIAVFFNLPILVPIIKVMGIKVLFSGINTVQNAFAAKNMLFKNFFFSTLAGTLVSAIIAVPMAYQGYGAWALVAQNLSNTIINTIFLWFTLRWRPCFAFSLTRMISLFSFGAKLLVASVIHTTYSELRNVLIGKLYTITDLGFYSRGRSFPMILLDGINIPISRVLFPAISKKQDDSAVVKSMTKRSIKVSAYIVLPLMAGLAAIAEPLVQLLLTDKWLPCVPYLQIACFTFAFIPMQTANMQSINSLGRSDIYLILEIIKKSIGLVILLSVMKLGVLAIAASGLVTSILFSIINAFPNKKIINYGYWEQVKDIAPYLILSLCMCIIVYCINFIQIYLMVKILVQIIVGVVFYIGTSLLFNMDSLRYILNTIKSFKNNTQA